VVKHLMLRGYIAEEGGQGRPSETGPNVILLSDLMLQNGRFANMAEFPVLQMLYRQGMILPDHPNNTGRKPILVGSADQVAAQLTYIYRGNYGLAPSRS
jgi:hemerythrin